MCASLLLSAGAQFSTSYFGAKFAMEAPEVSWKIFLILPCAETHRTSKISTLYGSNFRFSKPFQAL